MSAPSQNPAKFIEGSGIGVMIFAAWALPALQKIDLLHQQAFMQEASSLPV